MVTAGAKTNHLGYERVMGNLDFTVGTAGFSIGGYVEFEPVDMYVCYLTQIKDLSDTNQQMGYLKKVMEDLMREIPEITPDTMLTVISDRDYYKKYCEKYEEYRERLKEHTELNKRIKQLKFGGVISEEGELELKLLLIDEVRLKSNVADLKSWISSGFWMSYFGVSFKLRGVDVRVIIRQKRHRFSVKVKNQYILHRNIWSALRVAK